MAKEIKYSELEKHFSAPKVISPRYSYTRMPRKLKKKVNAFIHKKGYTFLTLNQRLWLYMGEQNPNYRTFLIKQICNGKEIIH